MKTEAEIREAAELFGYFAGARGLRDTDLIASWAALMWAIETTDTDTSSTQDMINSLRGQRQQFETAMRIAAAAKNN